MTKYVGNYKDYMPRRLTTEELVKLTRASLEERDANAESPEVVGILGVYDIVRYRLSSRALDRDLRQMGYDKYPMFHDNDVASEISRIGFHRGGVPLAVFRIYNEQGDASVDEVLLSKTAEIPDKHIAAFLNEIGLPLSHNSGLHEQLAKEANCWLEDGKWVVREPRMLVKVTYERFSVSVSPMARETIDVLLQEDVAHPLDGNGDETKAYWAKAHYRDIGFYDLEKLSDGMRPGFSSWMPTDEIELVKSVNNWLDTELGMRSSDENSDNEDPSLSDDADESPRFRM